MNQRENLIGGAVLLVIALLIGFLILRPKGGDRGGDIQSSEEQQLQQVNSILKPSLLPSLRLSEQGALTVSQGKGYLPGQVKWRYRNSWPNPDLKVRNSEGEIVELPSSGKGGGGTLWMNSPISLSAASAGELARMALNDNKLTITEVAGKSYLESKKLVASKVALNGSRLRIEGLFTSRVCNKKGLAEPAVAQSCRKQLRSPTAGK